MGREDFVQELAKPRTRIAELHAEREQVRTRPSIDGAARRVRATVEALAGRRPSMGAFLAAPGAGPEGDVVPLEMGPGTHPLLSLLAALAPERLEALLTEDARQFLEEHGPGIAEAERAHRLAEIDVRLRTLEIEEEEIVRRAAAAGCEIARRGDAAVEAVLGLWDECGSEAA